MSAATEFAPEVYLPATVGPHEQPSATILTLRRPSAESVAAPLRLTRRGVLAVTVAVAAVGVALVALAGLSAPSPGAPSAPPATVTVHDGDTLWAIASRVAPDRDPRAEVADLQRRNHLVGVTLAAGQVLRIR
jgi:Tfp pilus assembly protein FimV